MIGEEKRGYTSGCGICRIPIHSYHTSYCGDCERERRLEEMTVGVIMPVDINQQRAIMRVIRGEMTL